MHLATDNLTGTQKQLFPTDLDSGLMASIQGYLDNIAHAVSFFVDPRELFTSEELRPDDRCVLIALHRMPVNEFPEPTTAPSGMVITTPDNHRFATLLLRGDKIALPDHAFEAWNIPESTRLLVVYLFLDAMLLERIHMDGDLMQDLSVCSMTAQSRNHPTYAELLAESDDTSWETNPLWVLDNRRVETAPAAYDSGAVETHE